MKKLTALVMASVLSVGVVAAEADHFTTRNAILPDVSEIINSKANGYLAKAVAELNASGSCDQSIESEKRLYTELTKYFANHMKGALVKDILYTDEVTKLVTPIQESVYSEWNATSGFLLGRRNSGKNTLAIYPIIRMGDQNVGVDKFEHMFGMGQLYFSAHHLDGDSLEKVLRTGILKEKFLLGGNVMETGVFAYGDLAANFNGMRFWNHMLQKRDDVLGKAFNIGPYVTCESGKWVQNRERPIDFKNYMDASMDESINCSLFASRSGLEKFQHGLLKLGLINSENESACPLKPELLEEIKTKYAVEISGDKDGKTIANFMINPDGNDVTSLPKSFNGN